jgi:hypothetical protein
MLKTLWNKFRLHIPATTGLAPLVVGFGIMVAGPFIAIIGFEDLFQLAFLGRPPGTIEGTWSVIVTCSLAGYIASHFFSASESLLGNRTTHISDWPFLVAIAIGLFAAWVGDLQNGFLALGAVAIIFSLPVSFSQGLDEARRTTRRVTFSRYHLEGQNERGEWTLIKALGEHPIGLNEEANIAVRGGKWKSVRIVAEHGYSEVLGL